MATDKNKVEFGISNLYVGTYEVDSSTQAVTMGTPYHLPGAVSLSLDAESNEQKFYADNVVYWSGYTDNGFTGSLEVARFTDDFKKNFMGYIELDDGGLAQIKNAIKPKLYLAFQSEGDAQKRRGIVYNVSLGALSRSYETIEENVEPTTESIDLTVVGDNATGITRVGYAEDATGYDTLFTNPPAPQLPSESES